MSGVGVVERLKDDQVAEVLALAGAAAAADGVPPLSDQVLMHVQRSGDPGTRHLLAYREGQLAGYGFLDSTDSAVELVVHPAMRRVGVGRQLVLASLAGTEDGRLRAWAHGMLPGAVALADSLGFTRSRLLWQFRRSLSTALDQPHFAEDITVRPFVVGQDEQAWLRINSRAFADHPEQGKWTLREIESREKEPWFNPAGFLLAERDGALLGFHWTKVHSEPGKEPIGEVYVLGVDPSAHGAGVGKALTLAGLAWLRSQGLKQAMLYVDESNPAAVVLYRKLGFTEWSTDAEYRRGF